MTPPEFISARFGDSFSQVVDEVVARYGIGRRFASAYLSRYEHPESLPTSAPLSSLDEFLSLPSPYPDYFEYAVSANQRGEIAADWLLPYLPIGAHRMLDINCGVGGLLVAFARRGFDVFGFDADADNANLARANTHDFGILNATAQASILDAAFAARLGRFDLVTMFGTLGAVPDSERALRHALSRLGGNGVLVFDAPNPDALTLFEQFYESPPLEYYIRHIEKLGCRIEQIESPFYFSPLTDIPNRIQTRLETWAADAYTARPEPLGGVWRRQFHRSKFISRLTQDSEALNSGTLEMKLFAARYALERWTFLVRA